MWLTFCRVKIREVKNFMQKKINNDVIIHKTRAFIPSIHISLGLLN